MVKIAVAGGSGQVAREIIDVILATKKHEVIILSRSDPTPEKLIEGTTWVKVNFHDRDDLVSTLQGVHTVLSFILVMNDVDNQAQKTLIAACVEAGVKRFAPNEWSTADTSAAAGYSQKQAVREHLEELNKDKKVLEYCLFQPGLFTNYLSTPLKSSNHVYNTKIQFDLEFRRAILVDAEETVTLTTIQDLANVVTRAIEYEGEWPVVGGICGQTLSSSDVLAIAEKIRGPFTVDKVSVEDLKAGILKASWTPAFEHPTVKTAEVARAIPVSIILSHTWGAWVVSDEWNRLLPDYKFTTVEDFIRQYWEGNP